MRNWLSFLGKIKTAYAGVFICQMVLVISLFACSTAPSGPSSTKADTEKPSIESTQQNYVEEEVETKPSAGEQDIPENADQITNDATQQNNVNEEVETRLSAGEVITPENADQIILLDRIDTGNYAFSVAFSPDGDILATGGHGIVKLWDTDSGKSLRTMEVPSNHIHSLAFSPDGQMMAAGGNDGNAIRLWDSNSWEELRTLEMPIISVRSLAFSPDGSLFAATGHSLNQYWHSGDDGIVILWDVETWQELHSFDPEFWAESSLAFSPDGQILAVGGYDGIGLWDTVSWERLHTMEAHTNDLTFSPDGQTLASGGMETVILWESETGSQLHMLEGYDDAVMSLAFSPDGRLVAAAGWKGVVLWEQETGINLNTFNEKMPNGDDIVWGVAFSPDGRLLATIDVNATLKLRRIP